MRRALASVRRARAPARPKLQAPIQNSFADRVARWLSRHAPRIALRWFEPSPHMLGALGERLAERHLVRAGLRPIARNLRRRECELDLLLEDGHELVAVEVKTSRCHLERHLWERTFRPLDRVGTERRRRLARAALGLARSTGRSARVDVVEVWIAGPRRRVEWAWHQDVVPRA